MNLTFASEIVKCLRVSGPPAVDFSRLPRSCNQWEQTLRWLDHSGIALLFWQRLKDLEKEDAIPSEIGERLERNLADHRLRIGEMLTEFHSINQCFERAGVRYAAMKGLALTAAYCPDILLRTTYDYDYLLPRESIEVAQAALIAAGYVRKEDPEEHPIVYFHSSRSPRTPLSRDDLYSKSFPRTVELHYLFWDAGSLKIPLDLLTDPIAQLERRCIREFPHHQEPFWPGKPVQFYGLSEDDDLIFQILHAFRHILHDWCRLASLLDIAYFLDRRASDTDFWDQFLERLKPSRELSDIMGVVLSLAAGLFGATIPGLVVTHIIRTMRRPVAVWIERYGQDSALSNFSDNKFSLFLHREFIHDDAAWRHIRRVRLFPVQRPNQAVQGANLSRRARLGRLWRQGVYVSQRMRHHTQSTVQYALEVPRWHFARSRSE
jgi:hypothetical protein